MPHALTLCFFGSLMQSFQRVPTASAASCAERDKECLFSGITNSGSSLDYGNAQRTQHALKVSVFRMLKLDTIQKKYYIYAYYIYTKAKKAVLEKQQKHCQPPPPQKK